MAPPSQVLEPPRSPGQFDPQLRATSHISMVDDVGHAIAMTMTTTIENVFGSPLMVRGFLLGNEVTDSSDVPGEDGVSVANRVAGDKRPRSSMSPTLAFARSLVRADG